MHLIVIQHGLWGAPPNTAYLASLLAKELGDDYHILNSDVNVGNDTYDGIDVCGDRLHALVLKTIDTLNAQDGKRVHAISFVGYSLGGLINRWVAGKLLAEGVFDRAGPDAIRPVNFLTVATPHLGAWRQPINWYNRAFNYMVPVVTSRSGYQVVMQDKHLWGKPLLCLLSHPALPFMRALKRFERLSLMANVFHDRPVPYCTAAIRLDNPYEQSPPVPIDPKYPSIVQTKAAAEAASRKAAAKASAADGSHTESPLYAAGRGGQGQGLGSDEDRGTPTAAGAPGRTPEEQPLHPEAAARDAEAATPAEAAPLRPLKSTYLRWLLVFFTPLIVPALLIMTYQGRKHHCRMAKMEFDFSWIQRAADPAADSEASGAAAPSDQDPEAGPGKAPGAKSAFAAASREDIEKGIPSPPELPLLATAGSGPLSPRPTTPAPPANGTAGAAGLARAPTALSAVSAAPPSAVAAGARDDGEDGVVVAGEEAGVLLHDGIVEAPAGVHQVQEWLVEQLNALPWRKVDVDCRDFHAHAAIVMRNPARFKANADVLTYLVQELFARA
ncbi:hypothetical protein HYH03_010938 [Edaphochlamys debaryana]|uniref:DUF676 domain-containing protein n=1 Tax=Edaphochlamys debaryana TaxID=47281 RepID=A0A835XVH4_9CHLO|nr:hypothetical protein HYH03_010938 [Edaphochlamys debaryana]|eukprot:KAG2490544.1 hypothetical protein HYH03_010938 [Edaphochlamys debaryana]